MSRSIQADIQGLRVVTEMARMPDSINITIKTNFEVDEMRSICTKIRSMLNKKEYDLDETMDEIVKCFTTIEIKDKFYKDYLILTKNNEVILDLAFKDGNEKEIIKNGYELIQSDEPMEVIVNEDGKVYLYE